MADDAAADKPKGARVRKAVAPIVGGVPAILPAPVEPAAIPPALAAVPVLPSPPPAVVEAVTSPVLPSEALSGPAATSVPISEGSVPMASVASPTDAAEKAQFMLGDASARMKTAFEKSSKLGEEMVDFAKGNVEAVLASARVAAKAGESLGQEAADYGKKSFESATAAFKSMASVKSPTELFQLQSDYAKASFDSAVAEASKVSEQFLKVLGEIAQPLSTRYALAAEKFKTPAL